MKEALKKLNPTISEDSHNVISSPALESGVMHLETLAGQMILPCGQAPVPAKVSVQAGKGAASQISVIYGLHGSGSLESARLTQSLANKFRQKTGSLGSTLFRLTWKTRVTPSGRWIPALRASARRTSETAFTSWPTPAANEYEPKDVDRMMARREALKSKGTNGNGFGLTLGMAVAAWASPKATDGSGGRTTATPGGGNAHLDRQVGPTRNRSTAKTTNTGQLNPAQSRWL